MTGIAYSLSNTPLAAPILHAMANAQTAQLQTTSPTLDRVRALLALMLQYLDDPARALDLDRLCATCDRLIARMIFETAARIAGRTDLLATHEAYATTRRGVMQINVRSKRSALPLLQLAMLKRRRAAAVNRYRTAIGCRSRTGARLSRVRFANHNRRYAAASTRARASAVSPSHTPSRVSAPP